MPKPLLNERQEDFIGRCIEELITKEGKDKQQATAICYSLWNEK